MKRMVTKQKGKIKQKHRMSESACPTTGIKIVIKSCFADSTCNAFSEYKFPMHFPELSIGFPRLHVVGTCHWLCLHNRTHIRFQKEGTPPGGHLPTIGIPNAIYHYMTNTTKQQPTYKLFQNIMRPKKQLVSPPKTTKFTSICAFSLFLLHFCS